VLNDQTRSGAESPGLLAYPQPTRRFPIKKTNAAAISRLLRRNDFVGTATNSGEVVDVHFRETPLIVNRAEKALRAAGYSVDRYDSYALKVLGKHQPARRLCVRGFYSVLIDTDAWTPLSQFRAHTGLAAFQGVRGAARAGTRFPKSNPPIESRRK
jgi:hypothetical protein